MATIQAQQIVNSVIQDAMQQTTNRTALYDYVNRVQQRILRESKWRFLLSDPQYFVTLPGVTTYALTTNTAPASAFVTNLALSNFQNIAPGTMYNLTTGFKLEEDWDETGVLTYLINKDGSARQGQPRTYRNSMAYPGTISLYPAPDADNQYFPVPETPFVTVAPLAGCSLPDRIYYGVVTFVDSFGGEGTQCAVPFVIAVPAGSVVTVSSPTSPYGVISGNQVSYTSWNLYMGYALGQYNRQNFSPIAIGTTWTEGALGISTGTLQVPSTVALPPSQNQTILGILATGQLTTTNVGVPVIPAFWAIESPNGQWWEVTTNGSGFLETVAVPTNPSQINVYTTVYLTDTTNVSTWAITVTNAGQLQSTVYSTPPTTSAVNGQPPQSATIQPLNAYVIQFRYYMSRGTIVNPTDVLQIPSQYVDVVIAGTNYLASLYMDRQEAREPSAKCIQWKRDFEQGLAQIRRDLMAQYRKVDFISPDPQSQYQTQNAQGIPTMGW